jgi:adenosylhomocysteine nucleosidase
VTATGIVAALAFEARSLGRARRAAQDVTHLADGSLIRISGIGPEQAARAARELIAAGAGALLSWGVAGGLDLALASGTAVVPREVMWRAQGNGAADLRRIATTPWWRERLLSELQGRVRVAHGAIYTGITPVAVACCKARLHADTGAVAVDMESAAIAEVACAHGLPFLALRVVLDTASDSLPESLMRAFEPAHPSWWPLIATPADWPALLRLARQYRRARRVLRACARHSAGARGNPARSGL